ncbi:hypothetical protein MUG78_00170 [Gordonia alkaliphila]|uniref:hypothetical protein n=1 Tax=Gordonia alkaliphila TaxID=1053547 RepID=UPI001FF5ABBD|nr:hypothetical protein [Gordonia alkaliphila]MCK0437914.1 hypothetical protein [Gordonia alkaliphila]
MRLLTQDFLFDRQQACAAIYDDFIDRYGEDWNDEQEAEFRAASQAHIAEWDAKAADLLDKLYGPDPAVLRGRRVRGER